MSKATTDKRGLVTSQEVSLDKEYIEWLNELKIRFRSAQIKAAVKVNSEQLLFNWLLGRDLVIRKAEEKWGSGIVNRVSLDLQAEFPKAKGFSTRNLWFMKQWYSFYSVNTKAKSVISSIEEQININDSKLKQVASEIQERSSGRFSDRNQSENRPCGCTPAVVQTFTRFSGNGRNTLSTA